MKHTGRQRLIALALAALTTLFGVACGYDDGGGGGAEGDTQQQQDDGGGEDGGDTGY